MNNWMDTIKYLLSGYLLVLQRGNDRYPTYNHRITISRALLQCSDDTLNRIIDLRHTEAPADIISLTNSLNDTIINLVKYIISQYTDYDTSSIYTQIMRILNNKDNPDLDYLNFSHDSKEPYKYIIQALISTMNNCAI